MASSDGKSKNHARKAALLLRMLSKLNSTDNDEERRRLSNAISITASSDMACTPSEAGKLLNLIAKSI